MQSMFGNAISFNSDLSQWDVSSVTDMHGMFALSYFISLNSISVFNGDISQWDVSNVTDMHEMFANATAFNQNLSGWCVDNITAEPTAFSTDAALISANKPIWGTCPTNTTIAEEQLPTETSLLQNYPNPFNPSTQIGFSLAESSLVTLDVYSIDGTKVASLVNQVLNSGSHNVSFNAANLPTGLYLYRLNTRNQQITKKMMLMK